MESGTNRRVLRPRRATNRFESGPAHGRHRPPRRDRNSGLRSLAAARWTGPGDDYASATGTAAAAGDDFVRPFPVLTDVTAFASRRRG